MRVTESPLYIGVSADQVLGQLHARLIELSAQLIWLPRERRHGGTSAQAVSLCAEVRYLGITPEVKHHAEAKPCLDMRV